VWNTYVAPLMASSKLPSCVIVALDYQQGQLYTGQEPEMQHKAAGGYASTVSCILCDIRAP